LETLLPFTPLHFGPGLLGKALLPSAYSLTAFVATQVVIDVETLYYMIQREYPYHRALHSLAGAVGVGLGVALVLAACRKVMVRWIEPKTWDRLPRWMAAEVSTTGLLVGGAFGGASHTLLDGIVHRDVRPWAPLATTNPFYGATTWDGVELDCFTAGFAAIVILAIRAVASYRAG
jgi:hypothetical protein